MNWAKEFSFTCTAVKDCRRGSVFFVRLGLLLILLVGNRVLALEASVCPRLNGMSIDSSKWTAVSDSLTRRLDSGVFGRRQ